MQSSKYTVLKTLNKYFCSHYFCLLLFWFFQETVTILQLVLFVSPLVFVLGIQRISRPTVNLLVARYSPNECEAAIAVAVLTTTYPLGRMAYGWLNQLRTMSPTFQKVSSSISLHIHFLKLSVVATNILAVVCLPKSSVNMIT